MPFYRFTIASQFPRARVEPRVLFNEVTASSISVQATHVEIGNGNCDVHFPSSLSGAEELALSGIVDRHQAINPLPDYDRTFSNLFNGPDERFAQAFQETLPAGNPFWTSSVWYTNASKTKKIQEDTLAYNINGTVSLEIWKVFSEDGSPTLWTIRDVYDYSPGLATPHVSRSVSFGT